MKKIKNSYRKSGVNISLANKFVNHISRISKNGVKKGKSLLMMKILETLDPYLI